MFVVCNMEKIMHTTKEVQFGLYPVYQDRLKNEKFRRCILFKRRLLRFVKIFIVSKILKME